jgi:hypothetical protein
LILSFLGGSLDLKFVYCLSCLWKIHSLISNVYFFYFSSYQENIEMLIPFLILIWWCIYLMSFDDEKISHHSIKELVYEEYYNSRGRDEGNGIQFSISWDPSQTSNHSFVKKATCQQSALNVSSLCQLVAVHILL